MTRDNLRTLVTALLAKGDSRARLREHVARLSDAAFADELLGPAGPGEPRRAAPAAPKPAAKNVKCVHLGLALPNQPKVPCGKKLRDCSEFGACTFGPSDQPHQCTDGRGRYVCPSYEPVDP